MVSKIIAVERCPSNLHQRHETFWVNAPPRIGPKAIPSWPIPMFMPRNWACFLRGNITEMIVMAPFPIPDDPAPAMAPSNNEHGRRDGGSTDDRPELEKKEEDEEGPLFPSLTMINCLFSSYHRMTNLDIKVAVDLASERLQSRAAELVRATVPSQHQLESSNSCLMAGVAVDTTHMSRKTRK